MKHALTPVLLILAGLAPVAAADLALPRLPGAKPRNIILVLTDDHRADALGFLGHPMLETPHLDRLARAGAHAKNAMVTTSLCSPSRASILTGRYAHAHGVVDNYNPIPADLVFFPQYLQSAGYETALVGKWHMGGEDDRPQRGFDHWVSFKGQGSYWPDNRGATRVVAQTSHEGFNVNGRRVPQKGYITDELTEYALEWLDSRRGDRPFFLYLAHKAVHSDFVAAERHLGRYKDKPFPLPATAAPATPEQDKPKWVRDQRNSRHGIEFGYNLPHYRVEDYARRYFETLLAVDDSMGRILDWLARKGLLDSTLVVYMGDNGFHFGEHGLIDKRTAYEDSIRIPLLLHCPEAIRPGTVVNEVVANIDLAPTLLEFAGLAPPLARIDGRSFRPLLTGGKIPWRDYLLYEYFWEWNGPYTPTMHALRGERYKYIRYHGVWDLDELYDLEADPLEEQNLINSPAHRELAAMLHKRLFDLLEETNGTTLRVTRNRDRNFPLRHPDRSPTAAFPKSMEYREP